MSLFERLLGDDTPDEQVDLEARQRDANDAIQERVDPDVAGIEDCAVTGVAVVNEGPDGEPIVVPIARFSLGEDVEHPDYDLVWRLVGDALDALVPAFEEAVFVRHYDVQFTFDGDGLFEAAECRRVAVAPEFAGRFRADAGFDVRQLREVMLDAHDVDDDVAPVAWGECKNYADRQHAAIVTGGVTAAAGASAGAASCAGATTGGAGGAC